MFQSNFLQSHKVISQFTATFIHCSIGPLQTDRETDRWRGRQVREIFIISILSSCKSCWSRTTAVDKDSDVTPHCQSLDSEVWNHQACPHLSQFVQFDVCLQFPKTNL